MFIMEKINNNNNNKRRKERQPVSLLPFSPHFKETTYSPQMVGLGRNDPDPTKIFLPPLSNQTHKS